MYIKEDIIRTDIKFLKFASTHHSCAKRTTTLEINAALSVRIRVLLSRIITEFKEGDFKAQLMNTASSK